MQRVVVRQIVVIRLVNGDEKRVELDGVEVQGADKVVFGQTVHRHGQDGVWRELGQLECAEPPLGRFAKVLDDRDSK